MLVKTTNDFYQNTKLCRLHSFIPFIVNQPITTQSPNFNDAEKGVCLPERAFNADESGILLCGKGSIHMKDINNFDFQNIRNLFVNPFPKEPLFPRVCSTSLLKTLWEKEILLVMSNFSFSHSVFYPFGELSAISIKFENCRLQKLSFRNSPKFVVWERVKIR